jgi:hypothetical protein
MAQLRALTAGLRAGWGTCRLARVFVESPESPTLHVFAAPDLPAPPLAAAMKGMKLPKNLKGDINPRNMQQNIAQMSRMLPPHMLKMMGGPGAIQSLLKQMEGKF